MRKYFFVIIALLFCLETQAQQQFPNVRVVYDTPWTFRNLKLIPVRYVAGMGNSGLVSNKLTSVQDAILKNNLRITEMPKGEAEVPVIVIKNTGKTDVFINSGEILSGGKQDRMVSGSFVLKPGRKRNLIDVVCVEKNRWQKKAQKFTYNRPADMRLRKALNSKQQQRAVWEEIDRQYAESDTMTSTLDYKALYVSKEFVSEDSAYMQFYTQKFAESDSVYAGFIAVTDDRIIGAELFAHANLSKAVYLNIVRSYAATAINKGDVPVIKDDKIQAFINPVLSDKTRKSYLNGRGKIYFNDDNKILHIVVHGDDK